MILNNRMTQSKNIIKNYILQPKALGTFRIPPLEVLADGQKFQTQAFQIKVVKASAQTAPPQGLD